MDNRKSLILHFDSLDVIDELSNEQIAQLFKAIRDYNLWKEIKLDWLMKAVFIPFKNQFDRDLEKYNSICERNRNNGKKWWRPKETEENPVGYLETQENQNEPKKAYNKNDSNSDNKNDNKKESNNNIILSKDKEQSSEIVIIDKRDKSIDNLIKELKNTADTLLIAYDKNKDRMFAKHILKAKDYWEFCEKIWQDRIEFAKNIMLASVKISFWKWICAWPMLIYQNYSEVYNKALEKKNKTQENIIIDNKYF